MKLKIICISAALTLSAVQVHGADVLHLRPGTNLPFTSPVRGNVIGKFSNGWMLYRPDGRIHMVPPQLIHSHAEDEDELELATKMQMQAELSKEFAGFKFYSTKNYLICYNTDYEYARRRGALFERLYLTLRNYFTQRGFKLTKPKQPLVSIVFNRQREFMDYGQRDMNMSSTMVQGYYSPWTNRTAFFNARSEQYEAIKGQIAALKRRGRLSPNDRRRLAALNREIEEYYEKEDVSVTVHEAVHQVAFNSGLHNRLSDAPRWAVEGLAMYFESPNLGSRHGWHGFGKVNEERLEAYKAYDKRNLLLPITAVVASDEVFQSTQTIGQGYAQAWALTHFMFKRKTAQYRAYMKHIASLTVDGKPSPRDRIQAIELSFKTTLEELQNEWRVFMRTVKVK